MKHVVKRLFALSMLLSVGMMAADYNYGVPALCFNGDAPNHDNERKWDPVTDNAYPEGRRTAPHHWNRQRPRTWAQKNYRKIKNYSVKNWNDYFIGCNGYRVHPRNWHPDDRRQLFFDFELYQHEGYRQFLAQFPEYARRIVDIHLQRFEDKSLKEKLEKYYVKFPYGGLFGGTTVDKFIDEKLGWARKAVRKQSKREEEKRQRELDENRRKEIEVQQKKIEQQQPVKEFFVEHSDEVHVYKENVTHKKGQGITHDTLYEDRLQKRLNAIQTAINEGFRVSYKRYSLSNQTSALLNQNNIDNALFTECTGNAIQQQIHAEFVSVLNSGADLQSSDQVQHLTDGWFSTLGNFASVGRQTNAAGHYGLAHGIADICHGLCNFARATKDFSVRAWKSGKASALDMWAASCEFTKNAYEHPQETTLEIGRWLNDFYAGVWEKGAVRPAKQITQLAYLIRHHPDILCKAVGKAVGNLCRMAMKQEEMLLACRYDLRSKETNQLIKDFQTEWLDPLDKCVATVATAFWEMPRKEKAEEVVALVGQILATKGLGRLVDVALKKAASRENRSCSKAW